VLLFEIQKIDWWPGGLPFAGLAPLQKPAETGK
jgi:hypothetical protein